MVAAAAAAARRGRLEAAGAAAPGWGGGRTAAANRRVVGSQKLVGGRVAISWASSSVCVVVWSAFVFPLSSPVTHLGD